MSQHLTHSVKRYADDRGYVATCRCGWRVRSSRARDRDTLADEHETTRP